MEGRRRDGGREGAAARHEEEVVELAEGREPVVGRDPRQVLLRRQARHPALAPARKHLREAKLGPGQARAKRRGNLCGGGWGPCRHY